MKLIVLYGPENSGKTITLKMVYKKLKKLNLLETRCFKYYDEDARHNDFRDVLVLKKNESKSVATPNNTSAERWYDGTNPQDIQKAFRNVDDENEEPITFDVVDAMPFDDEELNDNVKVVECSNEEDDEPDEEDVLEPDVEDGSVEDSDFENVDSNCPLQAPDLNALINETANLEPKDLFLVGMSLEGDYGFQHDKKPKSSWTLHDRNLYKNLKEMRFCDTIICACSILKDDTTQKLIKDSKKMPVYCVVKFLRDFAASHSIKFRVVKSKMHGADGWNKKLKDNQNNANEIVSLI